MTSHSHNESPEKRYVCLHRAIEQGCATDKIWEELSDVCHRLGYLNESARSARRIVADSERERVEFRLAHKGIMMESVGAESPADVPKQDAPSPSRWRRGATLGEANIREEIADSAAFLFLEHIPFTLMTVTLIFPLVVGVGGMLTAGTEFWVLPTIALIPVLCIAGVIAAMLQRIVADSAAGFTEAPRISDVPRQSRRALMFLRDCFVGGAVLLMPGVFACQYLGTIGLPILIISAGLFPLAIALCQSRGDMKGLHPKVLLPATFTVGIPGLLAAGAVWIAFTPAMCALWLTEGSALFLRMSIVGPLAIVPLFAAARLLGRLLFLNRDKMENLIWTTAPKLCNDDTNIEIYDSSIVESHRVSRPQAGPRPDSVRTTAAAEPQQQRRRTAGRPATPAHPEVAQRPAPTPESSPSQRAAPVETNDIPALAGLADLGFKVLVGEERVAAGAASRGTKR